MDISIRMTKPDNIAHFGPGIATMPLEEYLLGVAPQEMSESAPMEALKAQAICARSYALRKIQQGIIMDDTSSFQAYSYPRSLTSPRSRRAINVTAGQVLTFGGKLAACYYSSTNNGRTKPVEEAWKGSKPLPYSVSKRDPWDIAAADRRYLERSHGVGMSQTGAKYAARQGASCEAILAFYFPGCTIAENIMFTLFDIDENYDLELHEVPGDPKNHIAVSFNTNLLDDFLSGWMQRKKDLADGSIDKAEYMEWKLNWPKTAGDEKHWRKNAEE